MRTIIEEFRLLTTKDIGEFFNDCLSFFRTDYNQIVSYYSGTIKQLSPDVFTEFERLDKEKKGFFQVFESHARQMKNTQWWSLLDTLEEIDNKFSTLRNINRWTRSSATNFAYSPNIQLDYSLSQYETLEKVSKSVLQNTNPQDDWVNIALDNELREEDYTVDGQTSLKLNMPSTTNLGIQVTSVVDTLIGKSIYGKDFPRKLEFSSTDGEGDLVVLDYDDTIKQTVEILIELRKNDIPDFPELGLQQGLVTGSNRALFNFPVITRQLSQVFASDDTLKDFRILEMKIEDDNFLLDFDVRTRLNEIEVGTVPL